MYNSISRNKLQVKTWFQIGRYLSTFRNSGCQFFVTVHILINIRIYMFNCWNKNGMRNTGFVDKASSVVLDKTQLVGSICHESNAVSIY